MGATIHCYSLITHAFGNVVWIRFILVTEHIYKRKSSFSARKHHPSREVDFAQHFLLSSKPCWLYLSYQINCVWARLRALRITGTGHLVAPKLGACMGAARELGSDCSDLRSILRNFLKWCFLAQARISAEDNAIF